MRIPLDRTSALPLYRQIAQYIQKTIREGTFPSLSRLPSVRDLARKNNVSRITVEKAYESLEAADLVQIRPGSGVFTLPQTPLPAEAPGIPADFPSHYRPFDPVPAPDYTDFSFGGGDYRLFPLKDFKSCLQNSISRREADLFSYGDIRGYSPLRQAVSRILTAQGLRTDPDRILMTNGSQQALSLTCRRFLKPGCRIATEALCYGEALNLFRAEGYEILPVPVDRKGMRTDILEDLLKSTSVDMVYTIPNFQNPTGATLPAGRREHLIRLMQEYEFSIIEDDYIGDLDYEGSLPPTLKAMAPDSPVFYIGTFSKMLIPGLRFGYLSAPPGTYEELAEYKRYSDLTSPLLIQMALESFITLGRYRNHIETSRRIYRKRRDLLVRMIRPSFPEELDFSVPRGGLFLWVSYPGDFREEEFFHNAELARVKLSRGKIFQARPQERSGGFRLNFASLTEQELQRGAESLARIMPN